PEPPGEVPDRLRGDVALRFAAYQAAMRRMQGQPAAEPPALPAEPVVLSYLVAATMILDLADKQRLLAAPDAASRLALEQELLVRETAILTPLPSLPAVD